MTRRTWGSAQPEPWLIRHFPALLALVVAALVAAVALALRQAFSLHIPEGPKHLREGLETIRAGIVALCMFTAGLLGAVARGR